ncbi:TIGR00296 family protein [archaeon]|nr:TIGR00296 family protein [archaeon]
MELLTDQDGQLLVHLARESIQAYLTENRIVKPPERDQMLKEKRGVFCTLKNYVTGNLRGCIGLPYPEMPLGQAIVEAAISSATSDPRFSAMSLDEFEEVVIEVTVLTPPEKIETLRENLPSKIEIGKHGLIIKKGFNSGLLLPQVAEEQECNPEQFLDMTCCKAGLSSGCWKQEDCEVFSFQGQIFKELSPHGQIIKK